MNYVILLCSLVLSTLGSVLLLKKKSHKRLSMLLALVLNASLLGTLTWISYRMSAEARVFGIGQTNVYELIFAIPILTWINFIILQFVPSAEME